MYPLTEICTVASCYMKDEKGVDISPGDIQIQPTRKDFTGDYTIVVFPLSGRTKQAPAELADQLGGYLVDKCTEVADYSVVKGFLNLSLSHDTWLKIMATLDSRTEEDFSHFDGQKVVVEYSSPNTNKPLHLGHIRNILLGWAVSRLYEKCGAKIHRTQVINDRGIAICKSMLAWKKYGQDETPASTGIKGDHFVGKYYVLFEQKFAAEYQDWQDSDEGENIFQNNASDGIDKGSFFKSFKNRYFNEYSVLGREAREMLRVWEQGDPETVALWNKMNSWVYDGFDKTYQKLGVHFDSINYESETYLLGKDMIEKGLNAGVLERDPDGSVWADLTDMGLDRKLVLRSDGTAVYITQDLGTARQRYDQLKMDKMIYTVADEQNYHFQALFAILKKLGVPYADGLHHLSYGMVDLPSGRMKSREGKVVDADDLIEEVIEEARINASERGELEALPKAEQEDIIGKIGMAALKYQILKVDPRKRTVFNPEESVDLQGQTGPYIQNAYVRIQSVLRKSGRDDPEDWGKIGTIETEEKEILRQILSYPSEVKAALAGHDPSMLAHYAYDLAKSFHRFYHEHQILTAKEVGAVSFRLALSKLVAKTLKDIFEILGMEMPDRM